MKFAEIRIDQSLFGYEDGHRLLASSMPLGDQTSYLTAVSDLAFGATFGNSAGYWTGLPVPKLRKYVLMRTWPAPEMSRPGCVWTHALLLNPDDLGKFESLSRLWSLVKRPEGMKQLDSYKELIEVSGDLCDGHDLADVDLQDVRRLIRSLYSSSGSVTLGSSPGLLDAPIFAVWSQQWPRLRRNFSFQTSTSREITLNGSPRFDLSLHLKESDVGKADNGKEEDWVEVALQDIRCASRRHLRAFFLTYGVDVRRQRGSFRPLCEIEIVSRDKKRSFSDIVDILKKHFPLDDDAKTLKQDLIDGIVAPEFQIDFVSNSLCDEDIVFPELSQRGMVRLTELWPTYTERLLTLADLAVECPLHRAGVLFDAITSAIPEAEFWTITEKYPKTQRRMLKFRPDLICAAQIKSLSDDAVVAIIETVTADDNALVKVIPDLLDRNSYEIVHPLMERFPRNSAIAILCARNSGSLVSTSWMQALRSHSNTLLDPEILGAIEFTSVIFDVAEMVGWLSERVIAKGLNPWIAALKDVREDLPEEKRAILLAFLLSISIMSPNEYTKKFIETFFEYIHEKILQSSLPWFARDLLSPILADVGWLKSWDIGLRIRLSISGFYIENRYPPESFARLFKQRKAREMLADAAASVPGGKKYAHAIREK